MYFFCPLNIPELCRSIKKLRDLAEQKRVVHVTTCFPERFLCSILTWHLTVMWTIQEEAPFANCLVFSGKIQCLR